MNLAASAKSLEGSARNVMLPSFFQAFCAPFQKVVSEVAKALPHGRRSKVFQEIIDRLKYPFLFSPGRSRQTASGQQATSGLPPLKPSHPLYPAARATNFCSQMMPKNIFFLVLSITSIAAEFCGVCTSNPANRSYYIILYCLSFGCCLRPGAKQTTKPRVLFSECV